MTDISATKVNEVYMRVEAPGKTRRELSDYFSFAIPGAQFSEAAKKGWWDGRKRLYDSRTGLLYLGLLPRLEAWAEKQGYELHLIDFPPAQEPISKADAGRFLKDLKLPFTPRDYQTIGFWDAIRSRRATFLSPTNAGKTLSIYLTARWFVDRYDAKVLIIVPTIGLVRQTMSDFTNYGGEGCAHGVYGGQDKDTDKPILISTWQSIHEMEPEWFEKFGVLIGDEAHGFKADRLVSIATKCVNASFRYGFTGTLDKIPTHRVIIEGLFGPVRKLTTNREMIERGFSSPVAIEALHIRWPDAVCEHVVKGDYQNEMNVIVSSQNRNTALVRLARTLKGNTLILFQYVEKHGHILEERLRAETEKEIHYIHGGMDVDVREELRQIMEAGDDIVALCSYGTFSTGVSINRIHNLIFASPFKTMIRLLQSIGRGLRVAEDKSRIRVFDLIDDLRWQGHDNYTFKHWQERRKVYESEGFAYVERHISLKDIDGA